MLYLVPVIIFFIFYALIAWGDLRVALAALALFLPVYLVRFSIGSLPTTALEVIVTIIVVVWLVKRGREKKLGSFFRGLVKGGDSATFFFWPGLGLVIAAALTLFWAPDLAAAAGIWKAYFLEPFLIYLIAVDILKSRADWQRLFVGLGGLIIVLAVVAIIQRLTGWWSPTWEWTLPASRRVTAFFTSPNALGLIVAPITALYVAWLFVKESPPQRLERFRLLVIVAGGVALLLSVSRGAIIALLVALTILLFIAWSKKCASLLVAAGVVLVILIPATRSQLINLATFKTDSGQSRLALYQGSWELIKQNPVQGTGLAGFARHFEAVRPELFTEELIYPHNIFLNFWTETGLLGLLSVLWIIGIIFYQLYKAGWGLRLGKKQAIFSYQVVFIIALIPVLIHGLVDVPYFKNDLAVFSWLLLAGFTWALGKDKKDSAESGDIREY